MQNCMDTILVVRRDQLDGFFVYFGTKILKLRETITRVYVQRTGKPVWLVSEDMERDAFMSAAEAQAHEIVDLVAVAN
ncbi:hypothetical protein AHAS_Ahas15G0219700 [Arachis hypogaea]